MNKDDPELKNKLQLNIVKADNTILMFKTRDDILKLDKDKENNGSGTVGCKNVDKEDN